MRVYNLASEKNALFSLENKKIKISQIEDLNDPFELLGLDLPNRDHRKMFASWKSEIASKYGVICFSKGWSNPVLWSHYGDKHNGICLGFDVPDEYAKEINCETERLIIDIEKDLNAGALGESTMQRILFTKFRDWAYEQEVRIYATLEERDKELGYFFKEFFR